MNENEKSESDAWIEEEPPVVEGDLICQDRLQIVARIAAGGTAVTYEAKDRLLGESVAAKIAKSGTDIDKELFLAQYWKIAKLCSPHLPALLGYFEHESDDARYPVIVLELVLK